MKHYTYCDSVFDTHTITEPVIVDLIHSPSLQRLHNVDQAGYPAPFFPQLKRHSRFEHSLGVYLLLHRYEASLEEQVAGLIHDVSHTAFSHCADYSLADTEAGKTQSHQDSVFESFVRNSEIPEILIRYGLHTEVILNDAHFPLKERPLPDLCADRIDYSFRAAVAGGVRTKEQIQLLLKNLSHDKEQWFFTDIQSAREFAELFSLLNASFWCNMHSAAMFRSVGDCLRFALQKRYLTHEDFYTTDDVVLDKIQEHVGEDPRLKVLFDRMNGTIPYLCDPLQSGPAVHCKSRVVDPLCLHHTILTHLSELQPSWSTRVKKESPPQTFFIDFA